MARPLIKKENKYAASLNRGELFFFKYSDIKLEKHKKYNRMIKKVVKKKEY